MHINLDMTYLDPTMAMAKRTLKHLFSVAAAVLLFSGLGSSAFAHTGLKSSVPEADSTVSEPPAELQLTFYGPVRLVKLKLMGVGHEMPTGFKISPEATASYTVATPGMHSGEFTVEWSAIGEDGHTVSDTFSFSVGSGNAD